MKALASMFVPEHGVCNVFFNAACQSHVEVWMNRTPHPEAVAQQRAMAAWRDGEKEEDRGKGLWVEINK